MRPGPARRSGPRLHPAQPPPHPAGRGDPGRAPAVGARAGRALRLGRHPRPTGVTPGAGALRRPAPAARNSATASASGSTTPRCSTTSAPTSATSGTTATRTTSSRTATCAASSRGRSRSSRSAPAITGEPGPAGPTRATRTCRAVCAATVRVLGALLRLAEALDRSRHSMIRALARRRPAADAVGIALEARGDAELELWAAHRQLAPLERVLGRPIHLEARVVEDGDTGDRGRRPPRARRAGTATPPSRPAALTRNLHV